MKRRENELLNYIHDDVKELVKKVDKNTTNIATIQSDIQYLKSNGHGKCSAQWILDLIKKSIWR